MNFVYEFRKVAYDIRRLAEESNYVYDPDHKSMPEGGGWVKTQKGWTKAEHMKEMGKTQKIPVLEKAPELSQNVPSKPQEVRTPDAPDQKVPPVRRMETLWPQALPTEKPAPSPYSEFIRKPEIKRLRKDISVNPNTVVANLSQNKDYVPEEHKGNLVKLYKSWLAENEGKADESKIKTVKTAISMLEPPKFKKIRPRLTEGTEYLIQDNELGDELQELAGFKDIIKHHPQMSDKEYKKRIEEKIRLPRNQQQLKQAFVQHMSPQNYPSVEAFNAAKKRVQAMSVADFGKLLASIMTDDEEDANV